MPRGNERHRDSHADIDPNVPVVGFRCNRGIVIAHDGVIAERRDHACGAEFFRFLQEPSAYIASALLTLPSQVTQRIKSSP